VLKSPIGLDLRAPFAATLTNSEKSRTAVRLPSISVILRNGRKPKVRSAIVQAVTVPVIDLHSLRGVHDEPVHREVLLDVVPLHGATSVDISVRRTKHAPLALTHQHAQTFPILLIEDCHMSIPQRNLNDGFV
jgi:hypothetical protein